MPKKSDEKHCICICTGSALQPYDIHSRRQDQCAIR